MSGTNNSTELKAPTDALKEAVVVLKSIEGHATSAETAKNAAEDAKNAAIKAQRAAEIGVWPKLATFASLLAAGAAIAATCIAKNQLDSIRKERQITNTQQVQKDFYAAVGNFVGHPNAALEFGQGYNPEKITDWKSAALLVDAFNTYLTARELKNMSDDIISDERWTKSKEFMCKAISQAPYAHTFDYLDSQVTEDSDEQTALTELKSCLNRE